MTYEGVAKVNASRPHSIGEFEFFDPRALWNYLLMPPRIHSIDLRTEDIQNTLQRLIQNSEFEKTQNEIALFGLLTTMCFGADWQHATAVHILGRDN